MKYYYREKFSLSSEQMAQEPTDEFFTNLHILAKISERQADESRYGN